jgi:hypothetical protein
LALEVEAPWWSTNCTTEIRKLIREMSIANPLWGAPRIHGELLKLGIDVGQTSVAKYIFKRPEPPSQGWKTFLHNHADSIAAMRSLHPKTSINGHSRPADIATLPLANGYAQRLISSIRRECLDHVVVFGERQLCHHCCPT